MVATGPVSLRRLHPEFGIEISGFAVGRAPTSTTMRSLRAALRAHRLVVLRGHALDETTQLRMAGALGRLVGSQRGRFGLRYVPEVRYERREIGRTNELGTRSFHNARWHSDVSWARRGAAVTMLCAIEVDAACDATAFADMVMAYETLPQSTRAEIAGWHAFHHVERSREVRHGAVAHAHDPAPDFGQHGTMGTPRPHGSVATGSRTKGWRRRVRAVVGRPSRPWLRAVPGELVPLPGALHPVVRTHPVSGRRFVYLGDHAYALAGRAEADGLVAIDTLMSASISEANVYRHQWQRGDLVLFENRSLLHCRVPHGADTTGRVLRRCLIWEEEPQDTRRWAGSCSSLDSRRAS